jgi:TRAP-type C4-dicarboxylate transport system permease small subunit
MRALLPIVLGINRVLDVIAGVVLTFAMCLTVTDVIGRTVGYPVLGAYDIVGLSGIIIIGFAVPSTSWTRSGHVYMEFVLDMLPKRGKNVLNIFTRLLCMVFFFFIGFNLFKGGAELFRGGEGSLQLQIPLFPFSYALGTCCFIECLVFVCDIVKIWEDKYE